MQPNPEELINSSFKLINSRIAMQFFILSLQHIHFNSNFLLFRGEKTAVV